VFVVLWKIKFKLFWCEEQAEKSLSGLLVA